MLPANIVILSHIVAVLWLIYIKYYSALYEKKLIWRFNVIDFFLVLFIIINTLSGIYTFAAMLSALLFVFIGKVVTLSKKISFIVAYILLAIFALVLSIHSIPGFYRPLIIQEVISTNQFQLYLSTDKALAGLVLLAYTVDTRVLPKIKWVIFSLLVPLLVIVVSLFLGISLDVKYGSYLLWFVAINLFVTCLAEEVFFREMIQKWMIKLFPNTFLGNMLTVVIVTYLFVLAHGIYYPGSLVGLLYYFASFLYAMVYQLSRSVMLSILSHFFVNICHILLLEYPLNIT